MRAFRFVLALLTALATVGGLPRGAAAAQPPLDWSIPNGHFYTQANGFPEGTSPMGYPIVDDADAKFWTAFQNLGGVNRLGYPASQRFLWGGFVTQIMQKAVLQWRPETGTVDFVNVFDDLSRAGADDWLKTVRAVPTPVPASFDSGRSWAQIVAGRLDLLRARPALLKWYQSVPDALDLYGLPTSTVVDAGPMFIVRLQRAVLQEWKVDEPWAKTGQVTVANGGDVGKEAGVFPWKSLRPVAPPAGTWNFTPGEYTLSGRATWYGPGFVGRPMADGITYQPNDPSTTAANAYPLGSLLQVDSPRTNRTIRVYVRDTGRFTYPGVLDLSPAAFEALGGAPATGVLTVTVELLEVPTAPSSVITSTIPGPATRSVALSDASSSTQAPSRNTTRK
ncbi:MAG TPA: septal ring lytic transglycosylase RlpA family protein [Chloroflexota bacterium]|nr:septal ring lytic transglycosylase RlpA family protein [Chloroflexota bacterium]